MKSGRGIGKSVTNAIVNPITGQFEITKETHINIAGHCVTISIKGTGLVYTCEHCDWEALHISEKVSDDGLRLLESYIYGHALAHDCDDPCDGSCTKQSITFSTGETVTGIFSANSHHSPPRSGTETVNLSVPNHRAELTDALKHAHHSRNISGTR